jgi:hypothetical protein
MKTQNITWGSVQHHLMEPVQFKIGEAGKTCTINHRCSGNSWVEEKVEPFLAIVDGHLTYLCKGVNGKIYPFIPQGNIPPRSPQRGKNEFQRR